MSTNCSNDESDVYASKIRLSNSSALELELNEAYAIKNYDSYRTMHILVLEIIMNAGYRNEH